MIKLGPVGSDTDQQITQAFPTGQLAEHHAKHLVPASKVANPSIALITLYNAVKNPSG